MNCLWQWCLTQLRLPDVSAGKAQYLLHAADTPQAIWGRPSRLSSAQVGLADHLAHGVLIFTGMPTRPEDFWNL